MFRHYGVIKLLMNKDFMLAANWRNKVDYTDSLINITAISIPETGTERREEPESIQRWK